MSRKEEASTSDCQDREARQLGVKDGKEKKKWQDDTTRCLVVEGVLRVKQRRQAVHRLLAKPLSGSKSVKTRTSLVHEIPCTTGLSDDRFSCAEKKTFSLQRTKHGRETGCWSQVTVTLTVRVTGERSEQQDHRFGRRRRRRRSFVLLHNFPLSSPAVSLLHANPPLRMHQSKWVISRCSVTGCLFAYEKAEKDGSRLDGGSVS